MSTATLVIDSAKNVTIFFRNFVFSWTHHHPPNAAGPLFCFSKFFTCRAESNFLTPLFQPSDWISSWRAKKQVCDDDDDDVDVDGSVDVDASNNDLLNLDKTDDCTSYEQVTKKAWIKIANNVPLVYFCKVPLRWITSSNEIQESDFLNKHHG